VGQKERTGTTFFGELGYCGNCGGNFLRPVDFDLGIKAVFFARVEATPAGGGDITPTGYDIGPNLRHCA